MTSLPADPPHVAAHAHSIRHRAEIEASTVCGCFYCLATFQPSDVCDWIDGTEEAPVTARCPRCGIDSVIGSASGYPITEQFLRAMQAHWF